MSKAAGARAAEAIGINASLSVLGKCITALTEGRRHVPYLESKLTTLLRPALGGNSRTTVVVTGSMVGLYKLNSVDPWLLIGRLVLTSQTRHLKLVSSNMPCNLSTRVLLAMRRRTRTPRRHSPR